MKLKSEQTESDGFSRMGKPLSNDARAEGYKHCKAMGLNSASAWSCVGTVAELLERDKPYEAQGAGMRFLDLTGTYRLFAVLLTTEEKP